MSDASAEVSASSGTTTGTRRSPNFCLLCMHFYPEMISTGMHMTELATTLVANGVRMTALCGQPAIEHGSQDAVPDHMTYKGVEVQRVKAMGAHRGSVVQRFIRGFTYTFETFFAAMKRRKEFDGFVVTTNPPFLGVVAALIKKWFKVDY